MTPDEIELAGDASVQDGVLDLEYEAAYEGRVDFGFQDQLAAGLFLDQITETGLKCQSLWLGRAHQPWSGKPINLPKRRPFDKLWNRMSGLRVQQRRVCDHKTGTFNVARAVIFNDESSECQTYVADAAVAYQ